jgi:NAD(P)-dependent dehydrogenase (short-subunit alcohol dehydrogenase family)
VTVPTEKQTACIVGANRGIGFAFTRSLIDNSRFSKVFATYRSLERSTDLLQLHDQHSERLFLIPLEATEEDSIRQAASKVSEVTSTIHLLINCVGELAAENRQPEKSLDEVTANNMQQALVVNALPTLLIAKHFKSLLLNDPHGCFASLSAKVGSITDNGTGGWYAYRISKAALNMAIKNIAIEFNRMNHSCTTLALHPGTTQTQMTQNFLKNARKKYTIHSPEETAQNLLKILLAEDRAKLNGRFLSWNGSELPW